MSSLESLLCGDAAQAEAFALDCRDAFESPAGQRLLARLCAVAHPMQHTPGMTDHEHGRHEVVATLWRYGASSLTPP
ncbi:hypothetical protein UFOVP813_33 [uncultured Caudovirales phage]|uniref:Uncharacterized protein n=1 Tax=uncultured Caudovirales phage TaxID=2100421 RepID=A0A6J5NX43_9CAUD|nr:hypothetical protein UFOVP813_33 [uncultured Caudovirales phage]